MFRECRVLESLGWDPIVLDDDIVEDEVEGLAALLFELGGPLGAHPGEGLVNTCALGIQQGGSCR